jgi:hypothetical protein
MLMTALLAGILTAGIADCSAKALLTMPLESSRADYRASIVGYTLAVVKDAPGWQVEVYALGDRRERDNLLAPLGNWHGAFPFQVQPGTQAVFGNARLIKVRGTQANVCIRVVNPQVVGDKFMHGSLEIGWEKVAR